MRSRVSFVVLVILLSSCATSASQFEKQSTNPHNTIAQLPTLASLDVTRDDSAAVYFGHNADGYYAKSENAFEAGDLLTLDSSSGELSWAIYRFNGVRFDLDDSLLLLAHTALDEGPLYIGFSNFQRNAWEFLQLDMTSGVSEEEIPIPKDSPYVAKDPGDDAGVCYIAFLTWDNIDTLLNTIDIKMGVPAAAPENLTASDGTHPDWVFLEWEPVAYARGYLIEYKPSAAGDEAWYELQGPPGITGYQMVHHAIGDPEHDPEWGITYDYRVRTFFWDGDVSEYSNVDSGYLGILAPENVVATYNIHPDKIEVSWDEVPGAVTYLIERSSNGTDWIFLGTWGTPPYVDNGPITLADYYYRLQAAVPDGSSEYSSTALGSRLGWQKSDIDYGITTNPQCDIAILDGLLCVAYNNSSDGKLLFAYAYEAEPSLPADWELSTVRTGSNISDISLYELDGWPALAYKNGGNVEFSVAYEHSGDTGYSFRNTVVDSGDYDVHSPSSRIFGGKPTVSFVREDAGASWLCFAYSFSTSPASNDDWNKYEITEVDDWSSEQSLIQGPSAPRIAYTTNNDLWYASANAGLPTTPANWSLSEVDSGDERENPRLILSDGVPLIAVRQEPMPSTWVVSTRLAGTASPAGPDDWGPAGGGYGEDGSNVGSYLDLAYIQVGPGLCFRDNDIDSLCYLAAPYPGFVMGGWAYHLIDSGSDCGQSCSLVAYSNLPAIVYWDYQGQRLRLARGL